MSFHMRTFNQPSIEFTRISQILKQVAGARIVMNFHDMKTNAQKQKIAQMEFDVRRCLLACEFRTRSLLNNNCVNIRSHVARSVGSPTHSSRAHIIYCYL